MEIELYIYKGNFVYIHHTNVIIPYSAQLPVDVTHSGFVWRPPVKQVDCVGYEPNAMSLFISFPHSLTKEHRCYDTSGSPGSDGPHPGAGRRVATDPFRVLPKAACRPAGLTGRLVYWRRDSETERGGTWGRAIAKRNGNPSFFLFFLKKKTLDPVF